MFSGNLHTLCFVVAPLSLIILQSLIDPATPFVPKNRFGTSTFHNRPATEQSFSSALAAGGFGKSPTEKSTSSKKKKEKNTAKSKQKSPVTPYEVDSQETTKVLMEWLDEEEEVEGLEGAEIGISKSNGLRGVFSTREFLPGEYIVAVPYVSTLLVDEDFDPTRDTSEVCLRADEPAVGLKFWDNFYRNDENKIKYKAFLDCLPGTPDDPNFDGTPDFWSDEDIRKLEIPGVVDKMLARKESIVGLVDRLKDDNAGDSSHSALATIQQCCWLVQSRAFTTYKKALNVADGKEGLLSRVVLIPFIDMINHASRKNSNAEMQVVETKEYDESFYALVATQTIPKGTEIQICYGTGEETSLELFSKYGFFPQVEDPQKEKEALQKLLDKVEWSTTLEEDQAMLAKKGIEEEPMRTILSVRIYAKKLQEV